jgi:hypothetical protein
MPLAMMANRHLGTNGLPGIQRLRLIIRSLKHRNIRNSTGLNNHPEEQCSGAGKKTLFSTKRRYPQIILHYFFDPDKLGFYVFFDLFQLHSWSLLILQMILQVLLKSYASRLSGGSSFLHQSFQARNYVSP